MRKRLLGLLLLTAMTIATAWAQTRTVSGVIRDTNGQPIPGANVVIRGTARGTTTDAQGRYTLTDVPANARLQISNIGFVATEQAISSGQSVVDVRLTEDVSNLEEVVVTGLASSIKRSNAANAVASVNADKLVGTTRPATLDNALAGKVVGANIVSNSGAPGGGVSVRLRGISSINLTTEPLYVVDGIIINNSQFNTGAGTRAFNGAVTASNVGSQDQAANRLADLNPADIENVEVLKGPSASAIYGTRANAGVIVITTKRGKSGRTKVNFGQDVGWAEALRFLGSSNWDNAKIDKFFEVYGISGYTPESYKQLLAQANGRTWDYERLAFGEKGLLRNTRLSLSGGNERTKFYISGGLTDENGIMKRTGFGRNSIRANIDHKLSDRIDVSISSSYINSNSSRGFLGNDNNGVSIGYNIAYIPNFIDLTRRPDGGYPVWEYTGQNPFEIIDRADNLERTNRFLQSGSVTLYLLKKERSTLKFLTSGGVDFTLSENEVYVPDDVAYQTQRANPGASRFTKNRSLYTYVQSFLTFNTSVNGFDLQSQVGALRNVQNFDLSWIQGEGLLAGQRNPLTAAVRTPDQFFQRSQDVAVDLSQELNWKDRIIARAGIRFDRSSLNGDNTKWYAFPRANLAVNLTRFDAFQSNIISQLKPRVAFGRTGGVPAFGNYFNSLNSVVYDGRLGAVAPTSVGLTSVEPETAQEIEGGIDIGFFNNRLSLEATYYDKTIFNLLNPFTLSPGTGVTSYRAYPVGNLQNRGIELSLTANPVNKPSINWTTTLQFWNNRSKITKLDIPETYVGNGFGAFGRNRLRLGASPTAWYGTPIVNGQPTMYGDAQPKFQMSWYNSLRFLNNFDFSMLWHTSQGNYNSNLNLELKDEGGTSPDWGNDDDGDGIPNGADERLFGTPNNNTSYFIQKASAVRLREIALYYNVPKTVFGKTFGAVVQGVRVGVSAQNVLLFTNYFGYDTEASNFGNSATGFGVDLTPFPSSRRTFFHLSVDF